MTGSFRLDPQFDCFLYAPVCERDEPSLSVLSALTRQGFDPWQEAARLSQLPKEQAVRSLASIVERSTDAICLSSEASDVAARLIELLPSQKNIGISPSSMVNNESYLLAWLFYGIIWGTIAMSGANTPQTNSKYGDPSLIGAIVSQQTPSSLSPRWLNTD
jgi:hypothetical protein